MTQISSAWEDDIIFFDISSQQWLSCGSAGPAAAVAAVAPTRWQWQQWLPRDGNGSSGSADPAPAALCGESPTPVSDSGLPQDNVLPSVQTDQHHLATDKDSNAADATNAFDINAMD